MKIPIVPVMVGVCVAGLPLGFAASHLFRHESIAALRDETAGERLSSGNSTSPAGATNLPQVRSTETVESLIAADEQGLYGRLAAWLADAGESDIAAYWDGYRQKQDRSSDIIGLVFLSWTGLDPQAAIAANADSREEHYAWWAWACHDPKSALAAALAANPDRIESVAWGIGEFHPEWLREHFDELPEAARSHAISGMMKWDDGQNPSEALKFMKEHGYGANAGTVKALVRQNPWAAFDWAKQNPGSQNSYNASIGDPMGLVVHAMAEEHPEDLERLIAQTPSGQLKLKMESALFENLIKMDPEAALEHAKATTVPRIAAERYAALGLKMVKENPAQAFELAKDLLVACPNALGMNAVVEYPDSSSSSGVTIPGVREFIESLASKDPGMMLDLATSLPTDSQKNPTFGIVSSQWVERDLTGYTDWLERQSDQKVRDRGANLVANQLQDNGLYAEAIEWRMSTKQGSGSIGSTLSKWKRADPEQVYGWLEAADLPADRKAQLKAQLDQQN